MFLTKAQFCNLLAQFSDASHHIDLPPPTIFKPRTLWTGKQVLSVLVCPNKQAVTRVNLENEEKFYDKKNKHFCDQDGYAAFYNGELISGNLGKKTLGQL